MSLRPHPPLSLAWSPDAFVEFARPAFREEAGTDIVSRLDDRHRFGVEHIETDETPEMLREPH
jgi:hypothetical protein